MHGIEIGLVPFSASFLSKTLNLNLMISNAVIGKMGSKERRFTLLVNSIPLVVIWLSC